MSGRLTSKHDYSTSNNTLCPVESIQQIEASTGQPFTLSTLNQFLGSITSSNAPPLPKSLECSDCSKATYQIINGAFAGILGSDQEQNASQTCGASFVGTSLFSVAHDVQHT